MFQLGQKAQITSPSAKISPTFADRLAAAPLRMDAKTHGKMTRGKLAPEARIDLHGMTMDQAHPALMSFILSAQNAAMRLVLVITGKGKARADHGPIPQSMGVLRQQVPRWLHMPPLSGVVLQVTEAHATHGGGGALYVYLRRR
jgi:DNA-nicking Smr family endonuclease